MKNSKVYNIRTAVSNATDCNGKLTQPSGIIYEDPVDKGSVKDASRHITKRRNEVKEQYKVFNQPKEHDKEYTTKVIVKLFNDAIDEKKVLDDINNVIEKTEELDAIKDSIKKTEELEAIKDDYKQDEMTENLKDAISKKFRENNKKMNITEKNIDTAIDKCLKRSLYLMDAGYDEAGNKLNEETDDKTPRKYPCRDAIKKLLMASLMEGQWSEEIKDEIKKGFLGSVHYDIKRRSNRARAVEHQNMVVQPSKDESKLTFQLTQRVENELSENKKIYDHKEKQAFEKFVLEYATLDEGKRKDMRIRLRRILVLYFYGEDEAKKIENEWEDHDLRKRRAELVVPPVKKTDNKDDNWDIKGTNRAIREWNIRRYRESMQKIGTSDYFADLGLNQFWIHRIENEIEKIYGSRIKKYNLEIGYLSEKVWKNLLNLICVKYIALGKAVYQYAISKEGVSIIQEINKNTKESTPEHINIGVIPNEAKKGISSFDYELIKAEETLQRELAVYVTFAANHLAGAVVNRSNMGKNEEDVFLLGEDIFNKLKKKDTLKNILQFFGGKSQWEDGVFAQYNMREAALFQQFQVPLYALRNESFHFHTENKGKEWDDTLIGKMFEEECRACIKLQRDKLYSNNLPMFYDEKDLENILKKLYEKQTVRAAQIPAFNTILVKKDFSDFLEKELKIKTDFHADERETKESLDGKWESALYYLLKEIYYNLFLQDKGARGLFLNAVKELKPSEEKGNEIFAIKNFTKRIKDLTEKSKKILSLSEICQIIMTEQNLYNEKNRKVKPGNIRKEQQDSYAHYKMLLYKSLRLAFRDYLNKEENKETFGFIRGTANNDSERKVHYKTMCAADSFLPNYGSNQSGLGLYKDLVQMVKGNPEYQKWYLLGRFLTPRQVNMLVGAVRSHVQYVSDIKRRAGECRVELLKYDDKSDFFKTVDNILDICTHLSGRTSNNLEDYFDGAEDYAEHAANYLELGEGDGSMLDKLKTFGKGLDSTIQDDLEFKNKGIFYDEINPIMNRNIIAAKMYGTETVLAAAVRKVKEEDVKKYFDCRNEIAAYRSAGRCKNEEEIKNLKRFQEAKNKVELTNIAEYSEILDELQGQLVNWCYLRERDMMYYQLGFHYACLNNDSEKPEGYRQFTYGSATVEGIILYQIMAMYINGLSVFRYSESDNKWEKGSKTRLTSGKIKEDFEPYTRHTLEKENIKGDEYFLAGLELFEKTNMHVEMVELRNYIEHFHYFVRYDCSMLELYGKVFENFLSYDPKYRKNVGNQLYNILLRHFVKLSICFGTNGTEKKSVKIALKKDCGIESDVFTYKLKPEEKEEKDIKEEKKSAVIIPARGKEFLENIARILYSPYKDEEITLSDYINDEPKCVNKQKSNNNQARNNKGGKKTGKKPEKVNKQNSNKNQTRNGNRDNQNKSRSIGTSIGEIFKAQGIKL